MSIHLALVNDNRDALGAGALQVKCAIWDKPKWVKACSPSTGHDSGFFSVPEIGSYVAIAQINTGEVLEWYWITGVWQDTSQMTHSHEGSKLSYGRGNPNKIDTYKGNNIPQKHVWKTPSDHTIELSEKVYKDSSDAKTPVQEDWIKLSTRTGKHILINDGVGRGHDRIMISDGRENPNFIRIQSGDDLIGQNAIQIECGNNLLVDSREGCISLTVGRESIQDISIVNNGKGNITISNNVEGDINVHSAGDIKLNAVKDINVTAGQDINVTAEQDINVTAEQDINVTAEKSLNIDSSQEITVTSPIINAIGVAGDIKVNGISLASHTHSGVESGDDNTGVPNPNV